MSVSSVAGCAVTLPKKGLRAELGFCPDAAATQKAAEQASVFAPLRSAKWCMGFTAIYSLR
jgi:hypothetical protein